MKKFLGILAIAAVVASCDNAGSGTSAEDSAKRVQDSMKREDSLKALTPPPPPPAMPMNDSNSMKMGGDTSSKTKMGGDTMKSKM